MAGVIGTTLGHFKILAKIGQGGMGVVYRADDTTLDRQVAIKVLPDIFRGDRGRLLRFEREAKLLAALNHPNIAAIHGLEEADGNGFLVLEMVEGETLERRIARGPLPMDEALEVGRQIAEGLGAAHERGIIHRDLKPSNIKITPEGKVKILDFGLAKAFQEEPAAVDASQSPTITEAITRIGAIVGTASYMSPEQARGTPVDRRADIWAFGVVLFEMLTGRRCFDGQTATDVLAAVVTSDPDWSALPQDTPPLTRRLLARCLAKDRKQRLHDIADARLEIEESASRPAENWTGLPDAWVRSGLARTDSRQDWRQRSAVPLAVLTFAMAIMTGWIWFRSGTPVSTPDIQAMIPTAARTTNMWDEVWNCDISRDGRLLAYSQGEAGIVIRPLASFNARVLLETESAILPTFSPNGEEVAFFRNGKLFRTSIAGGAQTEIAQAGFAHGLDWGEDNHLYFPVGLGTAGIWRVAAGGGTPENVTTVRDAEGESAHQWPELLPGGEAILYTALGPSMGATGSRILAQRLGSDAHETLAENATYGRYLPTGHLLYAKDDGTLYAVRFSPSTLKTTGQPVAIQAGVGTGMAGGAAFVVFSATGTEIYLPRSERPGHDFVFTDRQGRPTSSAIPADVMRRIGSGSVMGRLSLNGMQIAMTGRTPGSIDVWIIATGGAEPQRLTLDAAEDEFPIWSPDGKSVAYTSAGTGTTRRIFMQDIRGGGKPTLVRTWPRHIHTTSWSPDGRWLAAVDWTATQGLDIWAITVDGKESLAVATGTSDETDGEFSPDGRWLAYVSQETGRSEVFVVSFPSLTIRGQVTTSGGTMPRWDASGRQIYTLSNGSIVAQSVDLAGGVRVGAASVLFPTNATRFDVTRDGQKFLLQMPNPRLDHPPLYVRTNWFDEIRTKVK